MRDIKFRGKLIEDSKSFKTYKKGTIIEGGYCRQGNKHFIVAHFNVFEVEEDSVSEYTGSIDRNKNEIFENDIVKMPEGFHPKNRPIVYSECGCWRIGDLGISFGQLKANGFVDCEVIGSTYNNP